MVTRRYRFGRQPFVAGRSGRLTLALLVFTVALLALAQLPRARAAAPDAAPAEQPAALPIYRDGLAPGWVSWSWDVSLSDAPPDAGAADRPLAVTVTNAWGGLYLHHDTGVDTSGVDLLRFAARASAAGQQYALALYDANRRRIGEPVPLARLGGDPPTDEWRQYAIPLVALGGQDRVITGVLLQDALGSAQSPLYLADIALAATGAATAKTAAPASERPASAPAAPTAGAITPPSNGDARAASLTGPPPVDAPFFATLPMGATLPSGSACAGRVRRSAWEPRPANTAANRTVQAPLRVASIDGNPRARPFAERVDGAFSGTTDEIFQWASCKWGFDDDITRAAAAIESWWRHEVEGDWEADCACYVSYGILQIKRTVHPNTFPSSAASTAFNVDYALAWRRACYEGAFTWLDGVSGNGATYQAGDLWGCIGLWYSGRWHDQAARNYIGRLQAYLAARVWLQPGF